MIAKADPTLRDPLLKVATVHSGRRGVNADVAPDGMRQIVGNINETPASNTNFAIFDLGSENPSLIGVVSLVGATGQARALETR